MKIVDYTIWRIIKPILEFKIGNFWFCFLIIFLLLPLSLSFYDMKDFWNVLNYVFVIPYTFTAARRLINELCNSFFDSINKINPKALSVLNINEIKLVKIINNQLTVYILFLITILSQCNYIVSDLGLLTNNSNFYKWNQLYNTSFSLSYISKETFFIYYITTQIILLLFSLISIVGLIQYISIIHFTFKRNYNLLKNKLPNPPFLGLDKYHSISSDFIFLILIILINSFTYLVNMRAIMPLNLIAFWLLIFIVFFMLFYLKKIFDEYLTVEKENLSLKLNSLKDNSMEYMQFSSNLNNIKTKIFSIKNNIITYLGIFLALLSIAIVFFKPEWITKIRLFIENHIVPWF